jgi:hypothetical protein
MITSPTSMLQGVYDLHVHAEPDVIPRAQDLLVLFREAYRAGMGGLAVKDHTGSTTGRAALLNQLYPDGPRCFSYLVLNPPVGGLNPYAVEAALREGVDIVCFPTYAAAHQIAVKGPDGFPPAFPRPTDDGITVLDESGALHEAVEEILELVAASDAVLATGHLSPPEILTLLSAAAAHGVQRMLVTHPSEAVPGMDVEAQAEAVAMGAYVEHCMLALTEAGGPVPIATLIEQIHAVGAEHVILSSDFGQVANGPVVAAFARYLGRMREAGIGDGELRTMTVDNPEALVETS